jgi:hypothetical protein
MQELIECLNEQLKIYEALLNKTLAEKEAFMKKDNDLFMSVLSERLNLMNDVSRLEDRLGPLREKWINEKDNLDEEFNLSVIELVTIIKGLMDNILAVENRVIEYKMKEQQPVTGVVKSKAINKYKKI